MVPVNKATPVEHKTLMFNTIQIRDLIGMLGDRNTFTGQGELFFTNPPKKNLQHTIFAVPAEILTRIGLDLDLLTPVQGQIDFDIAGGRVTFSRFKDVYSKKKVAKFYLQSDGQESYIDFDGNLFLKIKMKQYNLIFKLAELFTVTVQGTVKKPAYSLQKQ
jgi:hypothetical protein